MKTRLIIILIVFAAVTLIFELGTDRSDDSKSQEEIETESEVQSEEPEKQEQHYKFNPPEP